MALRSNLFRGDRALEACQVNDNAHLVVGTRGEHVKKVQKALFYLDDASIDTSESADGIYGRTTAAAVLAYKQKRTIVNRAYQQTADNIVGKMTITRLDEDFAKLEARPRLTGCTGDHLGGESVVSPQQFTEVRSNIVGDVKPQFNVTTLHIVFQEALKERETVNPNSLRQVDLVSRARELLAPFDLKISARFLPTFTYPYEVGEGDEIDVLKIRQAAEKAGTNSGTELRMIFCSLRNTTSTATSQGRRTGIQGFDNFVLLNKNRSHPDKGTVLHEMIHCSDDRFMNDFHPDDPDSVFSRGTNRTVLRNEHAILLSKCFFKTNP